MEKYIPDITENPIIDTFCRTCQIAPTVYDFDVTDFIEKILCTHLFDHYLDDCTIYTQADTYIMAHFLSELKEKNIKIKQKEYKSIGEYGYYREVAYWGGYLFMVWHLQDQISGKEIVEKYDIPWVLDCYNSLHTTSIAYAVRHIKEEMKREKPYSLNMGKEDRGN